MEENERLVLSSDPQSHTRQKLTELQALPLNRKIQLTQTRLLEWYNAWEGKCYIAFSGGKDSTVLADIAAQVCKINGFEPILFFSDTGLEFPEIKDHVKYFKEYLEKKYEIPIKLIIDYPRDENGERVTFRRVLEEKGYPIISKEIAKRVCEYHNAEAKGTLEDSCAYKEFNGLLTKPDGSKSAYNKEKYKYLVDAPFKISHKCCLVMKENPSNKFAKENGLVKIVGTMACESRARQNVWIRNGCNAFAADEPRSAPISFWTEQDIIQYIIDNDIPYASVYGKIVKDKNDKYSFTNYQRTGCIYCAFGINREKEPNRFQQLKETHPKLYEYCMRPWDKGGLGMDEVLDYIGVKH